MRVTRESVDARTLRALELLAASPVPLPTRTLADLTQADQSVLSRSLEATGFTKHDQQGRIEYRCDLIREKYRESLGGQAKKAVQELIDHIRTKGDSESLLLPLLLREAQDYEGLQGLLTPEEVLATVDSTGDISSVCTLSVCNQSFHTELGGC